MRTSGIAFVLLATLFSLGTFPTAKSKRQYKNTAHMRKMLHERFLNGENDDRDSESSLQKKVTGDKAEMMRRLLPASASTPGSGIAIEERYFWGILGSVVSSAFDALRKPLVDYFSGTGTKHERNQSCFDGLGCFYYEDNMSLPIGPPESPENMGTTFYFFTNNSRQDLQDLLGVNETTTRPEKTWTLDNWTFSCMNKTFNTSWPLMVVTHGFLGSKRTIWMQPLVKALLDNMTTTVLVVDWEQGANGSYSDVAMNSPMVGVLISMFLQKIIKETSCKIGPDNITLIGFSLGGQIMGFAGRHFRNATGMLLRRIAGLDPAGYLFDNNTVALSKTDAQYVDVIHTHAGSMENFKLGLNKQVGHVDFYPNGGSWQPGCSEYPETANFTASLMCSHYRAAYLFIESLTNLGCSFMSYYCDDWENYKECKKNASEDKIGLMGYYSYTAKGRGSQYLETNNQPPYCLGNKSAPENNYKKDWTLIGSLFKPRSEE